MNLKKIPGYPNSNEHAKMVGLIEKSVTEGRMSMQNGHISGYNASKDLQSAPTL